MNTESRFARPSLVAFAGLAGFLVGTLVLWLVATLVVTLPLTWGDFLVHLPMQVGSDLGFLLAWFAFWIAIGILVGMRVPRPRAHVPSPALLSERTGLRGKKSFTLIELLIVIAVIAVLATVVILALNPAELLRQARDSNRVSDLATINQALNLYQTQVIGGSMGSSSVVYVSVPDPTATSSAGTDCSGIGFASSSLPLGWTYHCATSSTYRDSNGEGWIPVDFTEMAGGSPLGVLPVDPVNTTSTGFYYTYTTDGDPWELTANMESAKYGMGGSNDVVTKDGGQYPDLYEVGSNLTLDPVDYDPSLVGYWKLDEGTGGVGATTEDSSGHGSDGTLEDATTTGAGPTWVDSGCVEGDCLSFDGSDDYVNAGNNATFDSGTISTSAWFETNASQSSGVVISKGALPNNSPRGFYLDLESGKVCWHTADASYVWHTVCSSLAYNDGQLYNVVVETSAAGTKVYIDGRLVATGTSTGYSHSSVGSLFIGTGNGTLADNFSGLIDDVRIYNRALSASEIQAIYNAEK